MLLIVLLFLAALVAACSNSNEPASNNAGGQAEQETQASQEASESQNTQETRSYTDAAGRTVELPAHPSRIVAHYFASELVALQAPVIATNYINAKQVLTEEQLSKLEDIGGEGTAPNLEKTISLAPDLILVPNFLEAADIDALSKIAPTVVLDYSAKVFDRLKTIGEITGLSKEADDWIASYNAKAEEKRKKVAPTIEAGETASAFILYQDKTLYIYGPQRLGPTMYDVFGFEKPAKVSEFFADKQDSLWEAISMESLADYAGDRIFLVAPDDTEESKKLIEEMVGGSVWKSLPAVKNNKAYVVSSRWAFNDPLTLDWLIDEMAATLTAGASQ
nr:ABC transporter substrate-binding protein [Paenibacillus phyllosphaerae]